MTRLDRGLSQTAVDTELQKMAAASNRLTRASWPNCGIFLSPDSAKSTQRRSFPENAGVERSGGDGAVELDATCSSLIGPENQTLQLGIDSIDKRLRQSNMSILSRYKVELARVSEKRRTPKFSD